MDPIEDFLGSQTEGSIDSVGSFSKLEGREALLVPVRDLDPHDSLLYAARAALVGGATKISYRRGASSILKIPTFGFTLFDNAPSPTKEEIASLLDGELHRHRRIHHLSLALRAPTQWRGFEASYLFGSKMIYWDGERFQCRRQPSILSPLNKRDLLGRNTMRVKSLSVVPVDLQIEYFVDCARYCRLPIRVGRSKIKGQLAIPIGSPAHQIYHNERTPFALNIPGDCNQAVSPGSYSAAIWVEPQATQKSRVTLLDEGLVSETIESATSHPGWEAVVWAENWGYDLRGKIRRDEYFEEIMAHVERTANQLAGLS